MDMGILQRILANPQGGMMQNQGRINRGFGHAGEAYNAMLGRYGGALPP
jgi:hypothetical protein